MHSCRFAAFAAVALAVFVAPAWGGTTSACNGQFVCSSYDFTTGGPNHKPLGSQTQVCTYGETELGGECTRPCRGERQAVCRCKTEEERREKVVAVAKELLYVGIGLLLADILLILSWLWMRNRDAFKAVPEVVVGNATEVVVVNASGDQKKQLTSKQPSDVAVACYVLCGLLPLIPILVWIIYAVQYGVLEDIGLFFGLVCTILWVAFFIGNVFPALRAFPDFVAFLKAYPANFCMLVHRKIFYAIPVVFIAWIGWCINQIVNPNTDGVYSVC